MSRASLAYGTVLDRESQCILNQSSGASRTRPLSKLPYQLGVFSFQLRSPGRTLSLYAKLLVDGQAKAEELYQKRVLTITGICVALLVVGIVCVVAYCKTKKQRKQMHNHLRQNMCPAHQNRSLANGPSHPRLDPEEIQMADYISKNVPATDHVIRRETETTFSGSHSCSPSHHCSTATPTSSHRYVSALTTPARLSPVDFHYSLATQVPTFEITSPNSAHAVSLPPAAPINYRLAEQQPLLRQPAPPGPGPGPGPSADMQRSYDSYYYPA
ncbi:hypothetical protein Celaphus_00003656, partial [Cervus elaphus hippelaphus]